MKYSHEHIQELLKPLFEYMKTEHPNNCKLVIEPFSAQLIYEHQEQIWLSEEFHDKFGLVSKNIEKITNSPEVQKMKDIFFSNADGSTLPDWAKDCCCDLEAAEQQRKDLETMSYDEYMNKWAKNANAYSITTSDSNNQPKDCTVTTTLFNGKE